MKRIVTDILFPTLSQAFDTEAIKGLLDQVYLNRGRAVAIESCKLSDVNYHPGKHCLLLYKAVLNDREFGRRWEQLFFLKVLKNDESPDCVCDEAIYLKSHGMVVWPFPYDPLITWLPKVFDSQFMKSKIEKLLLEGHRKIKDLDISLLSYSPQMRATFLYTMQVLNKKTGTKERWEWIGKTNYFKPPLRVFSNYYALWKEAKGTIGVPKPIGALLDPPMTFQEKISGTRLGAIVNDPNISLYLQQTACNISNFHHLNIPLNGIRGFAQEVRSLSRWCDVLCLVSPELKVTAEKLKNAIVDQMGKRVRVEAPVHADFHHTNVLIDKNTSRLIDMDEMAYGDPCLDVGRFLSSLRIPSLRTLGSFDGLRSQRDFFLETYLKKSSRDARDIKLFEAASLFTSAASAFRLQRKNWKEEIPMILSEAETMFSESIKGNGNLSSAATRELKPIAKNKVCSWAEDPLYIGALLSPALHIKKNLELKSCELKRVEVKSSYYKYTYKYTARKETGKVNGVFALFIHKNRENRKIYYQLRDLTQELERNFGSSFLPIPLTYAQELEAIVFEPPSGQMLCSHFSLDAAEMIARGFASFHRIKVDPQKHLGLLSPKPPCEEWANVQKRSSYVLDRFAIRKIKLTKDAFTIPFPLRLDVGHPFQDIGNLSAKALLYGYSNNRLVETKEFVLRLLDKYSEEADAQYHDLCQFTSVALRKSLSKPQKNLFFEALLPF